MPHTNKKVKYFAYGSNLSSVALKKRCPGAVALTIGLLQGYELRYDFRSHIWRGGGTADIIVSSDSETWGVLYEMSEEDIERLDVFEGVDLGEYRRIKVRVITDTAVVEAFSYEVVDKTDKELCPTPDYAGLILSGALEHKLPENYLKVLASRIQSLRTSVSHI